MKCIAKFIGEDGSMGLHNGESYRVSVRIGTVFDKIVLTVNNKWDMEIPYDTMSALIKNWDFEIKEG